MTLADAKTAGPHGHSTRAYLIALSLLLVLPTLAVAGFMTKRFLDSEMLRNEQQATASTRQGALAVSREVRHLITTATLMSEVQALSTGDIAAFHQRAAPVATREGLNITLRDLSSRQLSNSAIAWGQPLPNHSSLLAYDQEVLRSGKPAVSDFFVGIANKVPSIAVVVPVEREGRIIYLLSISTTTEKLKAALTEATLSGYRAGVIDRKGIVITRTTDPDITGKPVPAGFMEAVARGEALWRGLSKEGNPTLAAIAQTEFGWTVSSGADTEAASTLTDRTISGVVLGSLAFLLLGLVAAYGMARRITGSLLKLTHYAQAAGKPQALNFLPTSNREVNEVGGALAIASRELKAREKALEAKAEEWKALLETVPAAIWFTRDGEAAEIEGTRYSDRVIRLPENKSISLTARDEAARPTHFKVYVDGREADARDMPLQRAARGETVENFEAEMRFDDGFSTFLLVSAAPLFDGHGKQTGAVCAGVDITERKRAESLAFEQASLLEMIVRGEPLDACLREVTAAVARLQAGLRSTVRLADPSGTFIETCFSATIPASFGDAVTGEPIEKGGVGICGAAIARDEPVFSNDIASELRWTEGWRKLCLDHGIRACRSQPIHAADGACFGSLMLCFDGPHEASAWELKLSAMGTHIASIAIERSRTIKELEESVLRQNLALSAGEMGVWDWHIIDDALIWDDAMYKLFGTNRVSFTPTNSAFAAFIVDEDRARLYDEATKAMEEGQGLNSEFAIVRGDGARRILATRSTVIRDAAGKAIRMVGVNADITERKAAEQAIRDSDQRQSYLLKLADALRPLQDPIEIQETAMRVLGQHLGASRAGYSEDQGDGETIQLIRSYNDGAQSIEGVYRYADYDQKLLAQFQAGVTTVQPDVANDPSLTEAQKQAHAAIQLGAVINKPLVKNGVLTAVLFVHQNKARAWTPFETELVEATAERIFAAIEQARAEAELGRSETKYRNLFDSIDEGFCVIEMILDKTGAPADYRFLEINKVFEAQTGLADAVGKTALELVPNLERWWIDTYGEVALTGNSRRFEHRSEPMGRWFNVYASRMDDQSNRKVAIVFNDISERKNAEATRALLINELNHRVKNTLATVQSISARTLRNGKVDKPVREALEARLFSLARTHDTLTQENWEGADLVAIAAKALAPFQLRTHRFTITGKKLWLPSKAALAIAMALHELATNAVKHGAMSNSKGRVELSWSVAKGKLTLRWTELGGPPVKPPVRQGFGSRLLERGLAHELGGETKCDYRKAGVRCVITLPIALLNAGGGRKPSSDMNAREGT
jgi:PAS domain S-box-containing protein